MSLDDLRAHGKEAMEAERTRLLRDVIMPGVERTLVQRGWQGLCATFGKEQERPQLLLLGPMKPVFPYGDNPETHLAIHPGGFIKVEVGREDILSGITPDGGGIKFYVVGSRARLDTESITDIEGVQELNDLFGYWQRCVRVPASIPVIDPDYEDEELQQGIGQLTRL